MPWGTRMAASTTPATRSGRSHRRSYERATRTPGTQRSKLLDPAGVICAAATGWRAGGRPRSLAIGPSGGKGAVRRRRLVAGRRAKATSTSRRGLKARVRRCAEASRTSSGTSMRRACGWVRNSRGVSSSRASPSMPGKGLAAPGTHLEGLRGELVEMGIAAPQTERAAGHRGGGLAAAGGVHCEDPQQARVHATALGDVERRPKHVGVVRHHDEERIVDLAPHRVW